MSNGTGAPLPDFEAIAKALTNAGLESTALELYCELGQRGVVVQHLEEHFSDDVQRTIQLLAPPSPPTTTTTTAGSDGVVGAGQQQALGDQAQIQQLINSTATTTSNTAIGERRQQQQHHHQHQQQQHHSVRVQMIDFSESRAVKRKIRSQSTALRRLEDLYAQSTRDFHKFSLVYFKQQARVDDMKRRLKAMRANCRKFQVGWSRWGGSFVLGARKCCDGRRQSKR